MAQPTCVEKQTVRWFVGDFSEPLLVSPFAFPVPFFVCEGIPTVSTRQPSASSMTYLRVPSFDIRLLTIFVGLSGYSDSSDSLSKRGRLVIWSNDSAPLTRIQSMSCLALNDG